MKKILLMRPPYTRLRQAGQIPYFPLGIGYVGAMLEKNGFDVGIYNVDVPRDSDEVVAHDERDVFKQRSSAQTSYMNAVRDDNHPVWQEVRDTFRSFNPDAIGLSILSVEYPAALKISRIAKEMRPDIKIVWGGFHPTFMAEESLLNPEVDVVVAGEGEVTSVELFKAMATGGDLSRVNGIYLRKNGGVAHTGHRPIIADLNTIPFPARHLRLYPETYNPRNMGNLLTSRGCPFRCTFCGCRNLWEKKFRLRSPENVIAELRDLVGNYKTNHIFFMDDTFSLKKKYGMDMCKAIVNSGLNVVWTTGTRVDGVDDELIDTMKKAGCVYMDLGIETGSDRMSVIIKKDITRDQVLRAIEIINRHGIASGAFFMAGFLEETVDDLNDTFDLIKKCKTTHIAINVWDPMPGSELYDQAIQMGVVPKSANWADFPLWPDSHFAVKMTPEEFLIKCNEIAAYVYKYNNSFPAYFRRVAPKVLSLLKKDPAYLAYRLSLWFKERTARMAGGKGSAN